MSTSRIAHADVRTPATALVSSALQRLRIGLLVVCALTGLGWSEHAAAQAAMTVFKGLSGIQIDADNNGQISVGDTLKYYTYARNDGTGNLTNVVLSDPLTTPNTFTCPTVNVNGTCFFDNFFYVVTAADASAGSITNTASATSTEVPGPIASNTVNTLVFTGGTTSMTVTKQFQGILVDADGNSQVTVGDTLNYTVDAQNTGTVNLTNVVVSDPILTPNSSNCGTLTALPGNNCHLSGNYVVTAADEAAGHIINTAAATSNEVGPVPSNTVNTPVILRNPTMSVTKSLAGNPSQVAVGDVILYTIFATNTGNLPLHNVVITDPRTTPSTATCATVNLSLSCIFNGNYTVTAADATAGSISNTGSVTSTETPVPIASNTTNTPVVGGGTTSMTVSESFDYVLPSPTAGAPVIVGATARFVVDMRNTGTLPLTNVVVSDPKLTPNSITCASVIANAFCTLTGDYTVTAADGTAGSFSNTASATSTQIPGPVIGSTVVTPVVSSGPAISVQVVLTSFTDNDMSGNVTFGDQLHYTTTATNTGTVLLTNAHVTDSFALSGSTCNLAVNATCVLTDSHVVSAGDASLGNVVNIGSANSIEVPGPITNTLNIPVFTGSNGGQLRLSEVPPSNADGDHSGTVTVGDVLTYTITATNTGGIALTNVQITDPLLTPNVASCASLAINATCVLTGTHTVTATDAANGQIFDHPKATAIQLTSSEDTAIITPVVTASGAAMSVIVNFNDFVDTDNSGTTTAGDQLHVIVTAINSGSIPLTNVQVSETQTVPSSITCASLAVGATCVLTGTYTITAADITAANVFFTGSATSTQVPGPVSLTRDSNFNNTGPISTFSLQKVSGDAQAGAPGTTLPIPMKVRMLGASNTPLSGQQIDFLVVQGSAHFTNASATTDALGEASTQLVLGSTPGPVSVFVSKNQGGPDVVFTENITGLVAPTAALTIVSGNNQSLPINTTSAPLVVQLTNNNLPVANATITWSGTNVTLTSATSLTDVNGRATNTATLPSVGAASVSAQSSSPTAGPVTFSFNGSIANVGGLTPAQIQVATALDNGCAALAAQGTLTPAQQDLLRQCQALASANPGEVRNALDQMLPHDALLQTNAGIQIATAQFDNIKARIAALRSGAHGAHFGGLSFSSPSGALPLGTLGDSLLGLSDAKADNKKPDEVGSAFERWGFFASGSFGRGSADPRQATPGYGFHTNGITAGVDYRFNDQLIAGVSAGYAKYSSNVDNVGGGLNTSGWSLSGYSTFFRQDSWYLDGVLTWGSNSYDIARRIIYTLTTSTGTTTVNQTAKSNSSGTTLAAAGTFGRDFSKGPWSFGPYFRGTWTRTSFGSYQEVLQSGNGNGLGLAVQSRDVTAIASVLGAKLNYASSQSWGVLMPHAEVEWEHEFRSSPDSITAHFLQDPTATPIQLNGDAIDTDFFRLGLGMSFQFTGGRSGFIYYEKTLGLTGITQDNLTLGFRMEF